MRFMSEKMAGSQVGCTSREYSTPHRYKDKYTHNISACSKCGARTSVWCAVPLTRQDL